MVTMLTTLGLPAHRAHADAGTEIVDVRPGDVVLPGAPSRQPLDAGQPASIVDATALDLGVAPTGNYDDAVRLTPSVVDVAPNGPGLGEAQILSIRGFADGQYNVTFDGIPFADSDDFTHHSSAYFVMCDLSSITVDRGPGDATTIGDATFGGTVALRSIDPSPVGSASPSASFGSFGTRTGGLLLDTGTASLPHGASAVLDFETAQSDGALSLAAQRRNTVFGKLIVPMGPSATLTLLGNASRTVQNEPPGATLAQIAASGPATALDDDPHSQAFEGYNSSVYRTDLSYAALDVAVTSSLDLSDTLYSYGLDRHFGQGLDPNGETPNGTAIAASDVPGQSGHNGLRAWGDIARLIGTLPAGFSLETGLWVERQTNSRSLVEIDQTDGMALDPVLAPVPGVAGSRSIDRLQQERLLTLQPYVQLDWQLRPWLRITAGLKGAWSDRDVSAPVMEGTRLPTRVDRAFGAVLPAFGLRARVASGWSAYAQIAQGFLAPQLQFLDVDDPAAASIAPERTWNFQLGTVWRGHQTSAAVDLYEILFDHAVGVRTIGGQSLDFDEGATTYRGIEAELGRELAWGLGLYANGSLNQAHQAGAAANTSGPAPLTPQATLSYGLTFARAGWNASLLDHWTGGSYGDVGRRAWIAPYNQLDGAVGTSLPLTGSRLALKLQIFNLLDSRRIDGLAGYTVAAGTPLFWTQAGRSLFASGTIRF